MPFKSPGLGNLTRLDSAEYDSETFWTPCSARRFPYSEFSAPAKNIFIVINLALRCPDAVPVAGVRGSASPLLS
jgi:hypothetical protein